jgi:hypothetical protein
LTVSDIGGDKPVILSTSKIILISVSNNTNPVAVSGQGTNFGGLGAVGVIVIAVVGGAVVGLITVAILIGAFIYR